MSVYQVEEYYISVETKESNSASVDIVRDYLESEGFDFEIQKDCIVVDGFDSEGIAEDVENTILDLLG